MVKRALMALVYGDLFMRVLYATRPYEKVKGSANKLHEKWSAKAKINIRNGSKREFNKNIKSSLLKFKCIMIRTWIVCV